MRGNKRTGRSGARNKVSQGLRHLWQLLLDGRVAGDVIEVAPDPSTNILRNVTDPVENQDAATKKWTEDNFAKVTTVSTDATSGNQAVTLPNIADVDTGDIYIYRKEDSSTNTVTLSGDANVDGRSSVVLYNQYETIILKKIGSVWAQLSDYEYNNTIAGNLHTLTVDSPNLIILDFDEDLTIPAASGFPKGKIYEIYSSHTPEEYDPGTTVYPRIVFSNADLLEEDASNFYIPWQDSISLYSDGTNWKVLRYPLRKLQQVITATTYTVRGDDGMIIVDASSNNVTLTMPAFGNNFVMEGKTWFIKRIDTSGNTVTIDGAGSNTIEGELTQTIPAGDSWELYAYTDGAGGNNDWKII